MQGVLVGSRGDEGRWEEGLGGMGLRVGDPVVTAGTLSLAQAVQVNVEEGCALPDPCDSGPCPPHSYCSDDWDSFSCRCHPGEQGPPRPLTPPRHTQTSLNSPGH
ncbi:hypothetical protein Nmel_017984 [Mimus melanotis]